MMNTINEAMKMMMEKYQEEYGPNAKAEEGETFVGVFNDGVIKTDF